MSPSFHNKILRVDLTTGKLTIWEPGVRYLRRYMGGWNIVADTLLREVPKGADPLGPENKLIVAPGVLTGLAVSGVSRNAVGAKSPLSGGFGVGEVGGYFGAEFKQAGFDAIIVEGVSPKPVYLWIKDGQAELRDADHLWGKTTKDTRDTLREELDDQRARCLMIGPGGENMVTYACVMSGLYDAAGRSGMGAVMGSKKLKAIAVRGTTRLKGADPDKVQTVAREMARAVRAGEKSAGMAQWGTGTNLGNSALTGNLPIHNFRDGEFPGADNLSANVFMTQIGTGMEGCYACAIRCKKQVAGGNETYTLDSDYGGPEYESVGALGSCCGVDDIIAVSKATELCNAYSIDTIGTGVTIAFAMECFENGLLTLEDTDGIDLRFGNGDAVVQLVKKIAMREGIGELLAEGQVPAAKRIGHGAEMYAIQTKNQAYPMHEPRFKRGLAISYAVSPTGADHCHALHDTGLINPDADGFSSNGGLRSMGSLAPIPLEDLGPDKVRATLYQMMTKAMGNCLPMCMFVGYTLDEYVDLVQGATGWNVSSFELVNVGRRALTLSRVFNMREGLTVDDDRLAERSYGPTTNGALADGGIDREELREAMHTYYGMMGWDIETGIPTVPALAELDVIWAAEHLPKK